MKTCVGDLCRGLPDSATFAFEPRDYAFLLSAETSSDPLQIAISWPQKTGGEISVRRKLASEKNSGL